MQVNLPLFNQLQIFHDFPAALQSNIAGMMSPMQASALLQQGPPWCSASWVPSLAQHCQGHACQQTGHAGGRARKLPCGSGMPSTTGGHAWQGFQAVARHLRGTVHTLNQLKP